MNNKERIMKVVEELKAEGKTFCTRNDILKRINSKQMIGALYFLELEANKKLTKIPCQERCIMYSLVDNVSTSKPSIIKKPNERQQLIIETVKLMKSEGKNICTRKEILEKAGIKMNSTRHHYKIFNFLEENNYLKIHSYSVGSNPMTYSLDNVIVENKIVKDTLKNVNKNNQHDNIHNIKWIKHEDKILVNAMECLQYSGVEQEKALEYISTLHEVDKKYSDLNDNLLVDYSGLLSLQTKLTLDKPFKWESASKMNELNTKIRNVDLLNTISLPIKKYNINQKEDTYEDLDEIFDSLLKTVDNISTRINTFKSVKEDKETQIKRLECDKNFYKNKCNEYRTNVTRLQEKIDALRWG